MTLKNQLKLAQSELKTSWYFLRIVGLCLDIIFLNLSHLQIYVFQNMMLVVLCGEKKKSCSALQTCGMQHVILQGSFCRDFFSFFFVLVLLLPSFNCQSFLLVTLSSCVYCSGQHFLLHYIFPSVYSRQVKGSYFISTVWAGDKYFTYIQYFTSFSFH